MNLNLFIAKKISGKTEGKKHLSVLSNKIACFSVAISIVVIFLAIAVTSGFKKEIGEKAMGFSGEIAITALGQDMINDLYPVDRLSYLEKVRRLDGVRCVEGVAYKAGIVKTDDQVQGLVFKGVDSLYDMGFYRKHLVKGTLPDFGGRRTSNDIVISRRLADVLGYDVGDDVLAYFVGEKVRVRRFKIVALYSAQLEEVDMRLSLVDLRHVQRLNEWRPGQFSGYEIFLDGRRDRTAVIGELDRMVMEESLDEDSAIAVRGVEDLYPNLFDWLELLDLNVLIIFVLMVVVAGFNMVSGLLIILFEKISMIGLLKSLGMKNRSICTIFIYRGAFIVLKGMALGNVLAIVLALLQGCFHVIRLDPANYFVSHIPIHMEVSSFLLLNVLSFLLMMLIMIIPSLFIAKVHPDKTLKMD